MERWKPNVTVATVITRNNQQNEEEYLLVHELRDGHHVYNQPAGHLDEGESLVTAAHRETLEETAWEVSIDSLIGIYRFVAPNGTTYLRHAFKGTPVNLNDTALDDGIIEAVWLTYEDILKQQNMMRSPLVLQVINDYRRGKSYPLDLIHDPY